jgi:2-dehydro-3-deoxygluconokinase
MSSRAIAIGEAMIELAPVGDGLYRRGYAGDTFNTAWHMQQLLAGKASIGFLTRVGTDHLSQTFVSELAADGLDTTLIARDPRRTMGLYMIELAGAERSFHYWRDQSAARLLADDGPALSAALRGAGLIHLSGITLAILPPAARHTLFAVIATARQAGSVISFDPNFRPRLWASRDEARDALTAMLSRTDIALPSFDDERNLWGDAAPKETIRRMADAGVREVIVKDGPGRVHVFAAGTSASHETPPVSGIRDTTGAGDAFNAGYLAARLTSLPPAQAVAEGQRLAATVIRHFGARAPREALRPLA